MLVVGGSGSAAGSAEIYDPETNTFSQADRPVASRLGQAAARLQDGRVLLVGGLQSQADPDPLAETYDPASGRFDALGLEHPSLDRAWATVIGLEDGRVLLVGGRARSVRMAWERAGTVLAVIDPAAWHVTTRSAFSQYSWEGPGQIVTGASLPDGRLLLVEDPEPEDEGDRLVVYDPVTGEQAYVAELEARYAPIRPATPPVTMADGAVLLVPGQH